ECIRLKLFGVLVRKERWGLSRRGWLIVLTATVAAFCLLLFGIYPFLAVTHRVNSNVLVVEGWIHEYAIQAAVDEFRFRGYSRIFTTGGPVEGSGRYTNDYNTSASVGAELLIKNGLAEGFVQVVPSRVMDHDRTYGSAVALRNWFRDHNMNVSRLNVITEDLHARRTRLLFQKAFGTDVQVGIIAVANVDYPANRWWHYSQGLKDVVSEFAAYLYGRLLFFPSESAHPGKLDSNRGMIEK
ncbi:MAG: ElyC/SanA/YdcF family protein, partial [Candidatus Udaeobacter sp.]